IYDTMQYVKPDVQTICFGMAMSMGSLLLAGGAPGKRMVLPNARVLIHQPSGGFEGQSSDIQIHAQEVLNLRRRVDEIYALHTGQDLERVHEDMERDRFFTAEEAEIGRDLELAAFDGLEARRRAHRLPPQAHHLPVLPRELGGADAEAALAPLLVGGRRAQDERPLGPRGALVRARRRRLGKQL